MSSPYTNWESVVRSAAQRECHYREANTIGLRTALNPGPFDCRSVWPESRDAHRWCAACVCKEALYDVWPRESTTPSPAVT